MLHGALLKGGSGLVAYGRHRHSGSGLVYGHGVILKVSEDAPDVSGQGIAWLVKNTCMMEMEMGK